ncbi:MAG: flagellar biosynthetic protein FliR [Planctomycetes bacterium]|nr:flagellar biosynthetic protein FliR [Planctomycetota bacterium]
MSEDMYMTNEMLSAFLTYILVLLRCGCLVLFSPFFSSEVFFTQSRIYLAALFPLLLVGTASRTAVVPEYMDMVQLALLAGQEFSLGLAICYLSSLIFTGVQMAGELAGQQIGFSMANVVDPQSGIEVPMLGFINMYMALMLFITTNLHLILIYILAKSYEWVGIGAMIPDVNFNHPVLMMGTHQATELIALGARMALPIMMIMLMNSVVEGFVTKTMPQMNIQVLGMPLRVILGLCMLVFIYPAICAAVVPVDWSFNLEVMPEGAVGNMLQDLSEMVRFMGEAGNDAAGR